MNDPLDDALEEFGAQDIGEKAQRRQEKWEERVVKKLILGDRAHQVVRWLKNEARDRTGEPALLFEDFMAHHTTFPIWLHCQEIPYAFKLIRADFNGKPKNNRLIKLYLAAHDHIPDYWGDGPFGLVFEMLNQKSTPFYVVHNLFRPSMAEGCRESITFKSKGEIRTAYIDNFDIFLPSIGWVANPE